MANTKIDAKTIIPGLNSNSQDWKAFHEVLRKRYGRKTANAIWTTAWQKRGNASVNTTTLRAYMRDQGLELDASNWESIKDTGIGVADGIGDFIGDIVGIGKWATIGVLVVVIGGSGFLVYSVIRRPDKYASLASATGAGAAKGIMKV
ncbi:MAG: hypothetical protein EXR21_10390 [Flavobacteriaceae bacterium]|nr:hypothetical protein [Flavobacteriaceae bacterium]